MRLCFMISSLDSGGAERVLTQLATYFADEKGHDVHIVTLQSKGTDPFYPLSSKITLHQLGLNQTGGLLGKIKRIFYRLIIIRKFIKNLRPNKIISFIDKMNIIVLLATVGLKKNIIVSERIDPRHHHIGIFGNIMRRCLYPFSKALIVQGTYIKGYFPYMKNKIFVIHNSISVTESTVNPSKRLNKIITVGRLNAQKDHETLIKAFSVLVPKYFMWILEIYGEGSERKKLEMLISKLSLESKVFLKGLHLPIQEKLNMASIFVFPSLFEVFPNALGEAMAAGLPVIVSNCDGNLELVQHEENGLVFPVKDQKALTNYLEELMENSIRREQLGKKAKKSIEKFIPSRIYKQWEDIIESHR